MSAGADEPLRRARAGASRVAPPSRSATTVAWSCSDGVADPWRGYGAPASAISAPGRGGDPRRGPRRPDSSAGTSAIESTIASARCRRRARRPRGTCRCARGRRRGPRAARRRRRSRRRRRPSPPAPARRGMPGERRARRTRAPACRRRTPRVPVAYSSAATNGPTSSESPSGVQPEAVLLQRDQLGAVHQLPERAVERCVAECRRRDRRRSPRRRRSSTSSSAGEVLLDLVVHRRARRAGGPVAAEAHRERRGRDQLARLGVEAEPAAGGRGSRARGRAVVFVTKRSASAGGRAARATASTAPGTRLVLDVEHAVEVDQERVECIGHHQSAASRLDDVHAAEAFSHRPS